MKQNISPTLSIIIILVVAILAGMLITKDQSADYNNYDTSSIDKKSMKIESNIFANNGNIPVQYTCNGAKTAVPLQLSDVPTGAKSLALIVFDPDAPNGGFVHWVIWNVDPKTTSISSSNLPAGAVQGFTGLGKPGYVPPCPPTGVHRYNFNLYALDTVLAIPASSDRKDLLSAMKGHMIGSTMLVGLYGKGQ
jgi:Raf kinase inhibitor-like YbhB/YbcL family protein